MSLQFKPDGDPKNIGYHFIVGLSGTSLSESDKRVLGELRPAGILLLKRNFDDALPYEDWLEKLAALLQSVREYTEREELLVTLDHEGGKVHRPPEPITHFPSAVHYAAKAPEVAKAMAVELQSMGVNVSWAPVADVHSNPENPIIGERAFGETPEAVAEKAAAFAIAMQNAGVATCAKHYPGHGDTDVDSHLELPVVEHPIETLRTRELAPFKALVEAGVPSVMTAHILYPQIDAVAPATLSELFLHDILRDEFGFQGVIVSDDLDMKAVSKGFQKEDTIGRAVLAGCDMFIVARYPDGESLRPLELAGNLCRSIKNGAVKENHLFSCFERIQTFMRDWGKNYTPCLLTKNELAEHKTLSESCL